MAQKPRKIWDQGVPLNDAWMAFADEKSKAKFEATFHAAYPNVSDADDPRIAAVKIMQIVSEPRQRRERTAELRQAMRADLLNWLLHENLHAYGFPVRPSGDRTPRRIPSEFWDNSDIDWEKGIASDRDSEFQRIRIVDLRDFPEIELKPKPGRKTHKSIIYQAVRETVKGCPNFRNLSHKQRAELVREFIKRDNPDLDPYNGKGFGDDAMRKNINSCLKEINHK